MTGTWTRWASVLRTRDPPHSPGQIETSELATSSPYPLCDSGLAAFRSIRRTGCSRRGLRPILRVEPRLSRQFCHGLKRLFRSRQMQFHGALRNLFSPKLFRPFLARCFDTDWVVYSTPIRRTGTRSAVSGSLHTSRRHLRSSSACFADNHVTFRWKNYAHGTISEGGLILRLQHRSSYGFGQGPSSGRKLLQSMKSHRAVPFHCLLLQPNLPVPP